MYEKFGQFINGKWQQSSDKSTYEVINPANEEILGKASKATPEDVDLALRYGCMSRPTHPKYAERFRTFRTDNEFHAADNKFGY